MDLKLEQVEVRKRNAFSVALTQECESKRQELEGLKVAFEEAKLFNRQLRDGLLSLNLVSVANKALEEAIEEAEIRGGFERAATLAGDGNMMSSENEASEEAEPEAPVCGESEIAVDREGTYHSKTDTAIPLKGRVRPGGTT